MSFYELAKERFSVRNFDSTPIPADKEARILDMVTAAPTAANRQPQRVYAVRSPEALEKLNGVCTCIFGAPEVLVVCYDRDMVWKNPIQAGYDSGEVDAAIVTTHLMLAAWEEGIASCWVRFFNADAVRKALGLPDSVEPVALLPIGYAAEGVEPAPRHAETRPLDELVHTL